MSHPVNPMVVDLSHWDPAHNYDDVANDDIFACIYKATEGCNYTDTTYVQQQAAAKAAGLSWGAYHFADSSDLTGQVDNFMRYACPDPDELFCLDWEDNGGDTMSLSSVKDWIHEVESQLGRPGECVLYAGNTAKEALGDNVDTFLGDRRLWLCQYGDTPEWQKSWNGFWLWQFTDGINGPDPHTINGVGSCDINSYDGTSEQLVSEWASGKPRPTPPMPPPPPSKDVVNIFVAATPGVAVNVRQIKLGVDRRHNRFRKEAK